jgi:hypothetical protein
VYEVQTLNHGRWTIQSRCLTEQQAIAEAREFFDRRQCIGVKVVKEAFDEAAKLYREQTVYRLPASTPQGVRGKPAPAPAQAAKPAPEAPTDTSNGETPPRRRSLFDLFGGLRS